MEIPKIAIERGQRQYRYLWLKYVTGIDLSRHCARSLHGRYSRHVNAESQDVEVRLDEYPHSLAWYLCGVTTRPYRWEDNPHLALEAAPGHTEKLSLQDLTVTVNGARPIHFDDRHIDPEHPCANRQEFSSCRNWQFAHYLHAHGVPDIRGDRPRGMGTKGVSGQLPLR